MDAIFILIVAWVVTALLCAVVATDKHHSGIAWGFVGLLFGPIALIATVGLADRRQHQLLRKIADALSGEISTVSSISQNESSQAIDKKPEIIEGPVEGAGDYNKCLAYYCKTVGGKRSPVYANSKITDSTICLIDADGIELAQFKKSRFGEWKKCHSG